MILMISRILFTSEGASSFVCAINPLAWASSPQNASLCDLATRKVYQSRRITSPLVGSYPTFSSLPVLCYETKPSAV